MWSQGRQRRGHELAGARWRGCRRRTPRTTWATTTGACRTPRSCRASWTTRVARHDRFGRHRPALHCTAITNEAGQADYPFYWTGTTHASSDGTGAARRYVAFGRALGYMNGAWSRRPRRRQPAQRSQERQPGRLSHRPRPAGRRHPHLQLRPPGARRRAGIRRNVLRLSAARDEIETSPRLAMTVLKQTLSSKIKSLRRKT